MKITPGAVVADPGEHVVMTGDAINGTVTLADGEVVDVSAPFVSARDDLHAAQIAHAIGEFWAQPENVHPTQIDVAEDGTVTVNDFDYDPSHYDAAVKAAKKG